MEGNGNKNVDLGIINTGVSDNGAPSPIKDDFTGLDYLEADGGSSGNVTSSQKPKKKKGRVLGGFVILAVLVIGAGLFYWSMGGENKRTRISIPVKDKPSASNQPSEQSSEDVTAAAIAEIRASASPTPSVNVDSSSTVSPTDTTTVPVTVPLGGTVTPVEAVGVNSGQGAGPSSSVSSKSAGIVSNRNEEKSIRAQPIRRPNEASVIPASLPVAGKSYLIEKTVTLPPFGAMLPIKTLGAVYTLRPSIVRFELARDIAGPGWAFRKGTKLIAQVQGSEYDRAYISLQGFIDPTSDKFIKVTGEILGSDGAPGIKGKRRRLGSRWMKVLSKSFDAGLALGQAALNRGTGTTIIMPGSVTSDIGLSPSTTARKEFVEIIAGSPAFLLITALPQQAKGVAPQTGEDFLSSNKVKPLSDAELAELLESGTPEQIREALPRMSPEIRQLAEAVLKDFVR